MLLMWTDCCWRIRFFQSSERVGATHERQLLGVCKAGRGIMDFIGNLNRMGAVFLQNTLVRNEIAISDNVQHSTINQ